MKKSNLFGFTDKKNKRHMVSVIDLEAYFIKNKLQLTNIIVLKASRENVLFN